MLACAVDHRLDAEGEVMWKTHAHEDVGRAVVSLEARRGQPILLHKYIAYQTTRTARPDELCERAERTLDRAVRMGFETLLQEQKEAVQKFWSTSDIRVSANAEAEKESICVQQAIRFNLFHVMQASARAEDHGIPAKGLTGQAYEGHYFGILKSMCYRFCSIPLLVSPRTFFGFAIVYWTWLVRVHVRSISKEPCIPGGRSMEKRHPPILKRGRPSTTLMPILCMH